MPRPTNCTLYQCHAPDGGPISAPCQHDKHQKCTGYSFDFDGSDRWLVDCDCCCHDLDKLDALDAMAEAGDR